MRKTEKEKMITPIAKAHKERLLEVKLRQEAKEKIDSILEKEHFNIKKRLCSAIKCSHWRNCPFYRDPKDYESKLAKDKLSRTRCTYWSDYPNILEELSTIKIGIKKTWETKEVKEVASTEFRKSLSNSAKISLCNSVSCSTRKTCGFYLDPEAFQRNVKADCNGWTSELVDAIWSSEMIAKKKKLDLKRLKTELAVFDESLKEISERWNVRI